MASWFKGLVAVTCGFVIVGIIYMIWTDQLASREAVRTGQLEQRRTTCYERLAAIREGKKSGDDQLVISDCIINGFLSDDDIQSAYKKAIERAKG